MTISEATPPPAAAERIPLSLNQEWMCLFDQGDSGGAFGPRFNHVGGWRLTGELNVATMQAALDDVVARHEILRTTIVRADEARHQVVLPPGQVDLVVRDLPGVDQDDRQVRAEELLNEIEASSYPADKVPLLRAVLGRFDDNDWVLALIVHHIAADAWSVQLIVRDLLACYAARHTGTAAGPPPVGQYQEFARAQLAGVTDRAMCASRDYWRAKLGDSEILGLPTDWARSAGLEKSSAWDRFSISAELTSATLATAKALRCTPFIVLVAIYKVLLHKRTGATDITVSTFTPGRGQARFLDVVGPFFNFLPLRTDLAGCRSFREVVERTRTTCLEAYLHDIPFAWIMGEAPNLMRAWGDDNLGACAFQVVRSPVSTEGEVVPGLRYAELRRLVSQRVGAEVPDGALWTLEVHSLGDIVGSLGYNNNLWAGPTMAAMIADFGRILQGAVADLDTPWQRL